MLRMAVGQACKSPPSCCCCKIAMHIAPCRTRSGSGIISLGAKRTPPLPVPSRADNTAGVEGSAWEVYSLVEMARAQQLMACSRDLTFEINLGVNQCCDNVEAPLLVLRMTIECFKRRSWQAASGGGCNMATTAFIYLEDKTLSASIKSGGLQWHGIVRRVCAGRVDFLSVPLKSSQRDAREGRAQIAKLLHLSNQVGLVVHRAVCDFSMQYGTRSNSTAEMVYCGRRDNFD